jgi:hypothetical protein
VVHTPAKRYFSVCIDLTFQMKGPSLTSIYPDRRTIGPLPVLLAHPHIVPVSLRSTFLVE